MTQADYSATPASGAANVATMSMPGANNSYSEVNLSTGALGYINKKGKTQFRLKASTAADLASGVLEIYSVDNSTYKPVLFVTY